MEFNIKAEASTEVACAVSAESNRCDKQPAYKTGPGTAVHHLYSNYSTHNYSVIS